MIYNMFSMGDIGKSISKIVENFFGAIDKITDNGVLASFITIGIFLLLCLIINNIANK